MKLLFKKQDTPFVYNKYYLLAQDKWAKKMNVMTTGLSKKTLMYLLVLFIVTTTGFLLINIYMVFSAKDLTSEKQTEIIKN